MREGLMTETHQHSGFTGRLEFFMAEGMMQLYKGF